MFRDQSSQKCRFEDLERLGMEQFRRDWLRQMAASDDSDDAQRAAMLHWDAMSGSAF
jgi:hypothetical protein